MPVGDVFDTPIVKFKDDRTGREVWKVTNFDDAHCAATYLYFRAMSADDRYLVYASDRTGTFELYRFDFTTEKGVQLTARDAGDGFNPKTLIRSHIHLSGNEVFYVDNVATYATGLNSLETRTVMSVPENHDYQEFHVSNVLFADGKSLLARFITRDGISGIVRCTADGSNQFEELFSLDDHSDLTIGHMTVSMDGKVIGFNLVPDKQNHPDLPHERRARCWGYNIGEGRIFNLLTMPPGHRATHETWGVDNRLYFHRKTVPTWMPTSIDSVDCNGEDYQSHFRSEDRKLGHHCTSHNGKWIVSDVQDQEGNELYLIDKATGEAEVLCWPDARTQDGVTGHVHPTFSPSDNYVIYTSDKTGKAAVFVVPLNQ